MLRQARNFLFVFFLLLFFEMGFLFSEGWSQIHIDPLASVSQVLGLKVCAPMPGSF